MVHYDLTSSNWMLVRLAVVALDVAAVVLIVWLSTYVVRWRRRLMVRLSDGIRQRHSQRPHRGTLPAAARLSKPTASHPSLR